MISSAVWAITIHSYGPISTNIDLSSLSGSFLYEFASINWEFFGFEWMGACDLSIENTQHLIIEVPSLILICGADDGIKLIKESLRRLTIQVSTVCHNSNTYLVKSRLFFCSYHHLLMILGHSHLIHLEIAKAIPIS